MALGEPHGADLERERSFDGAAVARARRNVDRELGAAAADVEHGDRRRCRERLPSRRGTNTSPLPRRSARAARRRPASATSAANDAPSLARRSALVAIASTATCTAAPHDRDVLVDRGERPVARGGVDRAGRADPGADARAARLGRDPCGRRRGRAAASSSCRSRRARGPRGRYALVESRSVAECRVAASRARDR